MKLAKSESRKVGFLLLRLGAAKNGQKPKMRFGAAKSEKDRVCDRRTQTYISTIYMRLRLSDV